MNKNIEEIRVRFLEAIEYIKATKDEAYRQISLAISSNEFYVSKVKNLKQNVTFESLSLLEKKYGISQEWIQYNKGKMLLGPKTETTMKVAKNEHSEEEFEILRTERDQLKDKLIDQMLKYQALFEDYNKLKEEIEASKSRQKHG